MQNVLISCPDCDLLIHQHKIPEGHSASCPRCNSTLYFEKKAPIDMTIIMAITGLLLYIPANFLPIMSFEILATTATNTMFNGVVALFQGGFGWIASLVLLCSMIIPLISLSALLTICLLIKKQSAPKITCKLLILRHYLSEWAMLEVYLLGILVAYVKLIGDGKVLLDNGLLFFVGLLFCVIATNVSFDSHHAWDRLGQYQ